MKLLILSCNTGEGHNSVATAMKEVLEEHHQIVDQKDTLLCWSKKQSDSFCRLFVWVYRYFPKIFDFSYCYAERHPKLFDKGSILYRYITRGAENLRQWLEHGEYDAVICTHMISSLYMTELQRKNRIHIPTVFIATDYTCSPMVANSSVDFYFIPNESLKSEFINSGIPEKRIIVSGIPVRNTFLSQSSKKDAKAQLNIPCDKKHLLMMCGSMGCGPMKKLVSEFDNVLPDNVILTVVCGTNSTLYHILSERYISNDRIHIVGFTNNISLLMDSADLFLTKPGGISVTEASVKGLPMVLVNAVAGCEKHNLHYFVNRGMAEYAESIHDLSKLCVSLLCDDNKIRKITQNLKTNCLMNSAQRIYCVLEKMN